MSSLKRARSFSPASHIAYPTDPETASSPLASQVGPNIKSKDEESNGDDSSLEKPFSKIVWIKVGSTTEPFAIHRQLLIEASSFFRSALSQLNIESEADGSCLVTSEAGSHMVQLPNESYEVFERFVHHLYAHKQLLQQGEKADDLSWTHLFDLYIFALKRKVPGLQNAVIDVSIRKHAEGKDLPGPREINRLYKVDVKAPNYRELFIDLFIRDDNLEHTLRNNRNYHQQFLTAMLIKLHSMNKNVNEDRWKGKRHKIKCDRYHVHEEEMSSET